VRRGLVLTALAIALTAGYAVLGLTQAASDARVENNRLVAEWHRLGERLVAPESVSGTAASESCFRYGSVRARPHRTTLCFDSRGRLIQAVTVTARGTRLDSVLPAADRATVRVSRERLALASPRAALLVTLRGVFDSATGDYQSCRLAAVDLRDQAGSSLGNPTEVVRGSLRRSAIVAVESCGHAGNGLDALRPLVPRFPGIQRDLHALASWSREVSMAADEMDVGNDPRLPEKTVRLVRLTYLDRMRVLDDQGRRTLRRVRVQLGAAMRKLLL